MTTFDRPPDPLSTEEVAELENVAPLCRDCQYYQVSGSRREWCLAPHLEAADLVQYVRLAPSECGAEGKWFNPKPENVK